MTARSENRYRAFAQREADASLPSQVQSFVADLNAIPKRDEALRPFGDIIFVRSHGGWFAECPITGYGYFYKTLREAVSAWLVAVFFDRGRLIGQPLP